MRSPGNSDLLYSLQSRMGVIELKATVFFSRGGGIRLKHPLTSDQRKFIKGHGKISGLSFVFVLLAREQTEFQEAILFRWNELDLLDNAELETCMMLASWHGLWPPRSEESRRNLVQILSGQVI